MIKEQIKKVEDLMNLDDCIDMAAQCSTLHRSVKQLLLSKIGSMPEFKKYKRGKDS